MRDVVVFSGSAHTAALAHRICDELGVTLAPAEIKRFSNDCLQAQLLANCRQRDVYIVQPLVPPTQEHLMELLLMIDAARGASAAQITAVIPHYAYARSDKKDASRISLGGRLVADMLVDGRGRPGADDDPARPAGARVLLGARRPPHRDRGAGRPLPRPGPRPTPSSSPPTSATPRRQPSSPGCWACRWPPARKQRLGDDRVVIDSIVGDVDGQAGHRARRRDRHRRLDRRAARPARRTSAATEAAVACTHGLFAGKAVERLREHPMISEVVTTDTVPAPARWPELRIRSVAGLFARGDLPDPRG